MVFANLSDGILSKFRADFNDNIETLPPKGLVTIHQKSLFLIWILVTILWLYRVASKCLTWKSLFTSDTRKSSPDLLTPSAETIVTVNADGSVGQSGKLTNQNEEASTNTVSPKPPPVTLNDAITAVFVFGCIMIYYFLCDYIHFFPKSSRIYNRDLFAFLCIILATVAIFFTTKETPGGKLLNRDQTEEWRGWMQVLFVWYHYFRAVETYNAIRIFIAAYVWMTGFGNFSFFWVRKDYSLRRMLKVLFRLNFLVVITTVAVDTSYMLYYICAMHTFWYFTVYAMMRPFQHLNESRKVMFIKFLIYFVIVTIIYEIPTLAELVYSPFSFILKYKTPKQNTASLHEWLFRSRLDHYMTFLGMLCAYFHPNVEGILKKISAHRMSKFITLFISSVMLLISYYWYKEVFILGKYAYNVKHPYTAAIPLLTFIYLRNSTTFLRQRYIHLFAFLGKVTLETYISQLHIYLQGNATSIVVYTPGYPLLNFIINSVIYLYMARLLFSATGTLNEYIFPADGRKMTMNVLAISGIVICSYLVNIFLGIL